MIRSHSLHTKFVLLAVLSMVFCLASITLLTAFLMSDIIHTKFLKLGNPPQFSLF